MSQLGRPQKALLAIWLVCWLGGLAVLVTQVAHGRMAMHVLRVQSPDRPDGFPVVRGVRPGSGTLADLVAGTPRPAVGDRLLRVGDADLRGTGQLRFDALAGDQTAADLRVSLLLERHGERLETWIRASPITPGWHYIPASLSLGLLGLALALRASRSRAGRWLAAAAMVYSLQYLGWPGLCPAGLYYAWGVASQAVTTPFQYPLLLTGLLFFPDDAPVRSRWKLAWPWLFAVTVVAQAGYRFDLVVSVEAGIRLLGIINVSAVVAILALVTMKFRHASPAGRRRIKWVLYGFYLAGVPAFIANVAVEVEPSLLGISRLGDLAAVFVPLSFLIAIVRFDLFDIDRLISATAAYTVVGIALLAGLLAALPSAAASFGSWSGLGAGTSQLLLSVLSASVAIPVAQRLRPQIDRVFFVERYRMEEGIRDLIGQLSACREPGVLVQLAGERLSELLRPESCVVYSATGTVFTPIFVRGRGGPPAFSTEGPLIAALKNRTAPLAMERFARRASAAALDPFDRSVLETLEAAVVLPIRYQSAGLVALVCFGPKYSGDVYTSTDLTLLATVGDKVSSELLRFEQEELARQAATLREGLRRYVPEAVRGQLEAAGGPVAGEREVTVLFVDIRGYTAFAQDREAAEIFSTVNRYTQAVSQVIRQHAGHVVEFNGDGMMAVFGAPEALPGKERQAVVAAREIVGAMRRLRLEGSGNEPLTVGIGIATGPAFVGSVQSADRAIWTALGNTTNLAARLQGLTRDLDAAIVVDAATHAAAGPAIAGFEKRERVEIRGRREPENVYLTARAGESNDRRSWAPAVR